jgi:hypothetical protein
MELLIPSAPMTRSASKVCPFAKVRVCLGLAEPSGEKRGETDMQRMPNLTREGSMSGARASRYAGLRWESQLPSVSRKNEIKLTYRYQQTSDSSRGCTIEDVSTEEAEPEKRGKHVVEHFMISYATQNEQWTHLRLSSFWLSKYIIKDIKIFEDTDGVRS